MCLKRIDDFQDWHCKDEGKAEKTGAEQSRQIEINSSEMRNEY